jgi:hypothetical protein
VHLVHPSTANLRREQLLFQTRVTTCGQYVAYMAKYFLDVSGLIGIANTRG